MPLKIFLGRHCQQMKPRFSPKGKPGLFSSVPFLPRPICYCTLPGPATPCTGQGLFPVISKQWWKFQTLRSQTPGRSRGPARRDFTLILRQGVARSPDSQTRLPTEPADHWEKRGEGRGAASIHCPLAVPRHGDKGRPEESLFLGASLRF